MFGNKKQKRILEEGISAPAVLLSVQDTGVTVNQNPRVKLTLEIQPDGDTPFKVIKKATVSRLTIPRPGDRFWVRFDPADPGRVEFDEQKLQQHNAAAGAQMEEVRANQLPPDLAHNGILGRATCIAVDRNQHGQLVACTITVAVRLLDGTPSYRATCQTLLTPDNATLLRPGQSMFAVRVDPTDNSRVALSPGEPVPIVPVTDPAATEPPERAMREGEPCRVTVLKFASQCLRVPTGEELYGVQVRTDDGSEPQVNVPVPDACKPLLQAGKDLPARRIPYERNTLTIDWDASRAEAGTGSLTTNFH